ncbi:MAG: M20/M25/M40 family metallo-hydrolase [Daejeonella sp.]
MKFLKFLSFLLLSGSIVQAQNSDSVFIRKIYDQALENGQAYKNLNYLCKQIGPRLSGSENAEKAVVWTKKLMEDYGFDRVYLQEVMVPHWVRGEKEVAYILEGKTKIPVPITSLGGTVATNPKGITAEIIEVQNFDELKALGESKVKGKIVFFNRAFDTKPIETFHSYSGAVDQRGAGAIEASKLGAIGVVVRSMTHALDDHPHTGAMRYNDAVKKIPAVAISTNAANILSEKLKTAKAPVQFYFKESSETLPDVKSYNVIGEIRGSEMPDEIITVGGHLDSWDLAEGAHDDGSGVIQSIEALRILKSMNYKPKRTIRAVMFMNEENGLRGGRKYAELAAVNKEKHIAAIESDEGGFTPRGFSIDAQAADYNKIKGWKSVLAEYGLHDIVTGESGADIGPLKTVSDSTALIGYKPDSQRYFDIHHSALDVFENVNRRELEMGAASITSLVYLIDQYGF